MSSNKMVAGVFVLLFFGTFSSAQNSAAKPVDPEMINKVYSENVANGDLLYKGKVFAVEGVVTEITDSAAGGGIGVAFFASRSDAKRLGGKAANFWSCSFDAPHIGEIAQLRQDDTVIVEGQMAAPLDFRHCRVRSPLMAVGVDKPQTKNSTTTVVDLETILKAYTENSVNAGLLYKGKVLTVEGLVTGITNDSAWNGAGRVSFASLSEVKQLGRVDGVNIWSCSFDASRAGEIAQLRRNDTVILEGQMAAFLGFRHCRVVTRKAFAPPSGVE